ncbi:MAG: HXXEE domain-containing protein [Acidobacteria bacterium]|nr:HXXEE domain-containing protein [Acidobacteriota bacterium]MBI3426821.1 HXXEE domain-containing protein [Acidobacteriota bacterium]
MPKQATFLGNWVWLFPLTYLVHIAEEYAGGFYHWMARVVGAELSAQTFLSLNAIFWVVMTAAVTIAVWTQAADWLMVALGAVVLINGSAHTIGSLITRSYSPGLLSGLCLWAPLGVWTLRRAWRSLPRGQFSAGVLAGIALHGLVFLLALKATKS